MSKPKPQFQLSNVLLVEVPPQFIALCEASGTRPQAAANHRAQTTDNAVTFNPGLCQ